LLDSGTRIAASYDLVIIGGGINGAAIARDAALRGLKVILLEKTDFGAGASTKTSKLAHGGLRYLEQYQFSLVKESLYERNLLLKNASHLVHPLKFVFPVYTKDPRPLWQVNLGLYVYDFFARNSRLPSHSKLNKEKIVEKFPGIESEGLMGGCAYYDAQMKDNRLVIENILAAEQAGATVLNYVKIKKFLRDQRQIEGVVFSFNGIEGDVTIKSTLVVNATGAWSNDIINVDTGRSDCYVAPTKGVHLVVPKIFDDGLILRAPQDARIFFVLPWEGYSLIGTTDTFFSGNPETVTTDQADIDYLLEAFCYHFPHLNISRTSIIATFAGLRPLVSSHHMSKPSLVSRDHFIQLSEGRIISVLGGKFTTHRRMSEEVVDLAISQLDSTRTFDRCRTEELPLPGAISDASYLEKELELVGLNKIYIDHLLQNYGKLTEHIIEIIRKNPLESKQICSKHPHILAELTYAIQFEHVKQVDDWLYRRTSIAYTQCQGKNCLEKIIEKLASVPKESKSLTSLFFNRV
jgi:glycerol-3-phosphate dehydrogenase